LLYSALYSYIISLHEQLVVVLGIITGQHSVLEAWQPTQQPESFEEEAGWPWQAEKSECCDRRMLCRIFENSFILSLL